MYPMAFIKIEKIMSKAKNSETDVKMIFHDFSQNP
jgi:hypothetical protein